MEEDMPTEIHGKMSFTAEEYQIVTAYLDQLTDIQNKKLALKVEENKVIAEMCRKTKLNFFQVTMLMNAKKEGVI